jgi:FkbM family methyltransferase
MLDIFREHYVPDTDMMDIGAHIGTSALLMEEVCSERCSVHAFEPFYHRLISHTLTLNQISSERVHVYPYAVGNETKEIFTTIKNWALPANFGASALDHSVPVPTSADYFGNLHVTIPVIKINTPVLTRRVSIIKIDVEGMEIQVVSGIKDLIERDRPVILIEIWSGSPLENFKRFVETELPSYELVLLPHGLDDFILLPKAEIDDA